LAEKTCQRHIGNLVGGTLLFLECPTHCNWLGCLVIFTVATFWNFVSVVDRNLCDESFYKWQETAMVVVPSSTSFLRRGFVPNAARCSSVLLRHLTPMAASEPPSIRFPTIPMAPVLLSTRCFSSKQRTRMSDVRRRLNFCPFRL
jgi:hypothetical protein